jgi:hypothetical protein
VNVNSNAARTVITSTDEFYNLVDLLLGNYEFKGSAPEFNYRGTENSSNIAVSGAWDEGHHASRRFQAGGANGNGSRTCNFGLKGSQLTQHILYNEIRFCTMGISWHHYRRCSGKASL